MAQTGPNQLSGGAQGGLRQRRVPGAAPAEPPGENSAPRAPAAEGKRDEAEQNRPIRPRIAAAVAGRGFDGYFHLGLQFQ